MTKLTLAELKNQALSFDRAEMRDVHVIRDAENYKSSHHMGVWNVDKAELATIASKNYCVIQHKYAVETVVEALSSLGIKAEATLKTSRHGIHVDLDFPEMEMELHEVGESFTSGISLVNDYAKTGGLQLEPRVTRLVCSNGMRLTEVIPKQRVRYSEELQVTLEGTIDRLVKQIISSDKRLSDMVSASMMDSVEDIAMKLLLKHLFKSKIHRKNILSRLGNKKEFSRWDLYNAVTNYATHGERLHPNVESFLQSKASEILSKSFTDLVNLKALESKASMGEG